ncbi:MAG: hypothetical protein CGU28_08450 [Candidatus Dactylopiibacterium carminicum]|uniref:AI-2E family transporter n=1 Tax=Candidatus Dactylopiibacterium carminicum TaxID=857335 RepID=A0A272ESA7_9RHOO|nr:hypothetical protein [Candidatus Dactylopiibacterium carminicum]KAF7600697.1 hypothetical protein BGI27_00875 [Candidatus Dactylopiibacterium carminicum]PAS92999.1 MAG: hypothetical protein CGU29_09460 [Candidatus Dactylopiibacterium carminicum]PAS96547.1 MAG: hypothetical protein CGU28_08450 [Candidatus Dactylopiibacterium carminicum]PAT00698.1 MAG: hypothetical protein BSR46_00875 [Candidatus Dactylopiibacterium carminicum]
MSGTSNAPRSASDQLPRLIGAAILLVMLDYGRNVLIPIALAIVLALLMAPLIRRLRHWGLGRLWRSPCCCCFWAFRWRG